MDSQPAVAQNPNACPWCKEHVSPRDENCPKCGYPLKGSEHGQERFRIERGMYLAEKLAKRRKVYTGIYVLFILTAMCFACGIAGYFARDNFPGTWLPKVIVFLSSAVVLLPITLYARKKPVLCFAIGAVIVIAGSIALYVIDSDIFDYRGFIVIAILLIVLTSGILAALAEGKMERDNNGK